MMHVIKGENVFPLPPGGGEKETDNTGLFSGRPSGKNFIFLPLALFLVFLIKMCTAKNTSGGQGNRKKNDSFQFLTGLFTAGCAATVP